ALVALFYTGGHVSTLVVMYSINVFVTFLLSEAGMVRFFVQHRAEHKNWRGQVLLFSVGFLMCALILLVVVLEKFVDGGWVTLVGTGFLVVLCFFIRRHYAAVRRSLSHLDQLFKDLPLSSKREELGPVDPQKPTAVLLTGGYGGIGVHSVLTLLRMFQTT